MRGQCEFSTSNPLTAALSHSVGIHPFTKGLAQPMVLLDALLKRHKRRASFVRFRIRKAPEQAASRANKKTYGV